MKTRPIYFIAYYGNDNPMAWDADGERFVPYGMHLYVTTWEDLDEAMKEMKKVRKMASGWVDDIFIDSRLAVR